MTDLGSVYGAGRQRLTELVSGLSEEESRRTVPACPEWSVHNVIAHLAGVCADVVNGNLEGVATDPWTAAQVEARKDWPLAQVLEDWAEHAAQVEPIVQFFPGRVGEQFVLDFTTHEHDVRQALDAPGARDSEGVQVGARFMVEIGLLTGIAVRGLPALEIQADDQRWVAGGLGPAAADVEAAGMEKAAAVLSGEAPPLVSDASPEGVLKVSSFELMRAMSGRRSLDQIKAFDWSIDPAPYLPAFQFGPFTTRPDPLPE
jgi:uncharacterized protein (TIGR03083 family)